MKETLKTVSIHEDFIPVDFKTLDSKFRILLGDKIAKLISGKMKIDTFQVMVGKEGDVLLRPTTHIPSREAWLYENPSALAMVKKGLAAAKDKKSQKISNLEEFFDSL